MPGVPFSSLPDHGRLWVFPLSRTLDDAESERCLEVVDGFLAQWAAHGVALRCGRELRDDRFLLIGVDVDAEAPSGCSIDALMTRLRSLGQAMGVTFIDHAPVWFRDGDAVRSVARSDFRVLAAEGQVSADTHVFDTTLTKVGQLRMGALERPASATWHGQAFFKESVGA
jgi:hypothetical protein